MIRLALPGYDLAIPVTGALLLRARRDLNAGADPEALGLALIALGLAPTRDLVLSRLAGGWSLVQTGAEALDVLAASGHALVALLALARAAAGAVQAPTLPAASAAPVAPAEPALLPDGVTFDGIPWRQASIDGMHPSSTDEQRARRALVGEAIVAHREGRLVEWANGRAGVALPR